MFSLRLRKGQLSIFNEREFNQDKAKFNQDKSCRVRPRVNRAALELILAARKHSLKKNKKLNSGGAVTL